MSTNARRWLSGGAQAPWAWGTSHSPVTRVRFRGQRVHVKRDDVFHLAGNKMRKMYWFLKQDAAFFRDAHLFSYGGSQSNAMLALAQLAHAKHVPFTYFSRALRLPNAPTPDVQGNLAAAISLGMQHVELPPGTYHQLAHTRDFAALLCDELQPRPGTRNLYVPQGAAFPEAQDGVALLAQEINSYVDTYFPDKRFSVVLPCGTGTTALYLAQHLHPTVRLYAVPCVGDAAYLHLQFQQLLAADTSFQQSISIRLPQVLIPTRKSRFGRLWWPLHTMYHELLQETQLEFDLVYGAFAWHTLFEDVGVLDEVLGPVNPSVTSRPVLSDPSPLPDDVEKEWSSGERELLYVHTGGTSGNASMLARYARKANAGGATIRASTDL